MGCTNGKLLQPTLEFKEASMNHIHFKLPTSIVQGLDFQKQKVPDVISGHLLILDDGQVLMPDGNVWFANSPTGRAVFLSPGTSIRQKWKYISCATEPE